MEFCQRAIALWTKLLGPAHFRVANEEYNEAKLLQLQGRMHEALPVMQRAYEKYKQNPGPIDTLFNMQGQLGYMLDREGRTAEGLKALRESLNEFQKLHPDGHKLMADTQVALGQVLLRRGLPKEAEPLFRRALDYRLSHFAKTHHLVAGAQVGLASALAAQHRYQEAAPLFQEGFDRYRDHPDGDDSTEVEQARAYWTEVSQAVGIR
jgi:tetratricopeptide (TPR) repeat protein